MPNDYSHLKGATHLLLVAGQAAEGESVLLIYDSSTREIVRPFLDAAKILNLKVETVENSDLSNHGNEPDAEVAIKMRSFDLILALTAFSFAHSQARILAAASGARFLSLPSYTSELLSHPMVRVDYVAHAPLVSTISNILTESESIQVLTLKGTNLKMTTKGRLANNCPAFVKNPGDLGSPPDIESNVSPLETESTGVAVVDGSITHPTIGLLRFPVTIEFRNGQATNFWTQDLGVQRSLAALFPAEVPERRVLAEFGIGLNPKAQLMGIMLSDEGTLGTVHLGLGSNFFVGGKNKVDFHLDFVIEKPSIIVDGFQIMTNGTLSPNLGR